MSIGLRNVDIDLRIDTAGPFVEDHDLGDQDADVPVLYTLRIASTYTAEQLKLSNRVVQTFHLEVGRALPLIDSEWPDQPWMYER